MTEFDAPWVQHGGAVPVRVSPWGRDFGAPLLLLAPSSRVVKAPRGRTPITPLPRSMGGLPGGAKLGCNVWPPSSWPWMEPSPGGGQLLAVGVQGWWSGRAKPSLSREDLGHQLPPRTRGAPGHIPLPGVLPGGCFAAVAPCAAPGYPGTRHLRCSMQGIPWDGARGWQSWGLLGGRGYHQTHAGNPRGTRPPHTPPAGPSWPLRVWDEQANPILIPDYVPRELLPKAGCGVAIGAGAGRPPIQEL